VSQNAGAPFLYGAMLLLLALFLLLSLFKQSIIN
jgi:hypothetical protein